MSRLKSILYPSVALSVLAVTAWAAAPSANAHGSSKAKHVTQSYDLAGFKALELGGVFDLDVQVGAEGYSITASGHEDYIENLEVEVNGDVLSVSSKKKNWTSKNGKKQTVELTITLPDLEAVSIGGVATGDIAGIDADDFDLDVGGVADLELAGRCVSLTADLGGVGDVDARELECKDVEVSMGGVGDMTVYASESVDASVGGIGAITVYGKPDKVEKSKTFLSSVTIK